MMTDPKLNEAEIACLKAMHAMGTPADRWITVAPATNEFRLAVDILVLSGLAERREDPRNDPAPFGDTRGWLDQWRLTAAGIEEADYRPQTCLFTS